MRVAIVSTYLPRACGIAVFSGDLRNAIVDADSSVEVEIVAMVRDSESNDSPDVAGTIRQGIAGDYAAAAAELNRSGVDVVLIEHEFGIFGGPVGGHILRLAEALSVPVVVTLHTVWPRRARGPVRHPARALCDHADRVMVFTRNGNFADEPMFQLSLRGHRLVQCVEFRRLRKRGQTRLPTIPSSDGSGH